VTLSNGQLDGSKIISEIEASQIEFLVSVPDIVTSDGLLWPLSNLKSPRLLRVCREDEGLGIAAGLSFSNRRALILIQHTGLLDSINALRAIGVEYALPICLMVGLLGREPGLPLRESARYGVRIIEPILDALDVSHHLIESNADVPTIRPAIEQAYASSRPVVLLLGRRPTAQ
jgi:sulfopyruvate decarboxylase subunit alpha